MFFIIFVNLGLIQNANTAFWTHPNTHLKKLRLRFNLNCTISVGRGEAAHVEYENKSLYLIISVRSKSIAFNKFQRFFVYIMYNATFTNFHPTAPKYFQDSKICLREFLKTLVYVFKRQNKCTFCVLIKV